MNNWPEIIRQVENVAKAGFSHISWLHDWEGDYIYSSSEMQYVRDMIRDLGLQCRTLHASEGGTRVKRKPDGTREFQNRYKEVDNIRKDYTSTSEFIRLAGVELIKNRIDLASILGCYAMALHLQLPWKLFEESPQAKDDYYRALFKSLDEIKPYAKNAGVQIAFENLICTPLQYIEESFDRIFNRYEANYTGFCWDVGHGLLAACIEGSEDYYHLGEKYQERLILCHLQEAGAFKLQRKDAKDPSSYDDMQIYAHDYHRAPFSGLKHIDWRRVAGILAVAPLEGPADFEVVISAKDQDDEFRQLCQCQKWAEQFDAYFG
jgi:sugar phosphate isomerase/epimerase